jgi:Asp-tRNA(Asn)/Glu-tRNA(Gln) amidotransferase A subunit family amidase
MKKLSIVVLTSFLCAGASSINQITSQQVKSNYIKNLDSDQLTAAQEQCVFVKVMAYCPELVLASLERDKTNQPKETEDPTVASRSQKAGTVVEKTGRPEKEPGPVEKDPDVQAAWECRLLALMECGVDVSNYEPPALPQGDLRGKAVAR